MRLRLKLLHQDWWIILGVTEHATVDQVKRAFKTLSRDPGLDQNELKLAYRAARLYLSGPRVDLKTKFQPKRHRKQAKTPEYQTGRFKKLVERYRKDGLRREDAETLARSTIKRGNTFGLRRVLGYKLKKREAFDQVAEDVLQERNEAWQKLAKL